MAATSPMDMHTVSLIMNRFDEIGRQMSEDRRDSAESRRGLHEKLEIQTSEIHTLANRVKNLEKSFEDASPTLTEFKNYKAQVAGAGKLGRGLWALGGYILAAAAGLFAIWQTVASWFNGGLPR